MSINIQLEGGLKKLSGQTMSKDKIIDRLGYTPANETTVNTLITDLEGTVNADIAVLNADLSELKTALEDYIKNHPDIIEDGSGEVIFTDELGNIIAKIDSEGFHTTSINADSFTTKDKLNVKDKDGNVLFQVNKDSAETTKLKLASGDVDEQLDTIRADVAAHEASGDIHVTTKDKATWNAKSEFSGEFRDLHNSPIVEDDSGELTYVDEAGNIIFKINKDGAHTTELTLPGGEVDKRIDQLYADLAAHESAVNSSESTNPIHIQPGERAEWNAKATTKYVDDAVAGLVNSAPEALNTLNELAAALGNDENFATTVATQIGEKAIQADFVAHRDDGDVHISISERSTWNNKSDFSGDYSDLTNAPDITSEGETESTLHITDHQGNIVFTAGELTTGATGIETTTVLAEAVKVGGNEVLTEITTVPSNGLKVINKNQIDFDDQVIFVLDGGKAPI